MQSPFREVCSLPANSRHIAPTLPVYNMGSSARCMATVPYHANWKLTGVRGWTKCCQTNKMRSKIRALLPHNADSNQHLCPHNASQISKPCKESIRPLMQRNSLISHWKWKPITSTTKRNAHQCWMTVLYNLHCFNVLLLSHTSNNCQIITQTPVANMFYLSQRKNSLLLVLPKDCAMHCAISVTNNWNNYLTNGIALLDNNYRQIKIS